MDNAKRKIMRKAADKLKQIAIQIAEVDLMLDDLEDGSEHGPWYDASSRMQSGMKKLEEAAELLR